MKKINKFMYNVVKTEEVTIVISFTPASQSGSFPVLTLDGKTLNSSGSPPTYEFTVTKAVGREHLVEMDFTFMPDAPDTAQYKVTLSGSEGGNFTFTVKKTDPIPDPDVRFKVVAA
ncbi:MAG TPA: hypothetical protein VLL54_00215 [Pyrinomonadaceae bacterium]|nr:hypothetical protein [Pyrinomonadaceae bacterium]